MVSYQWARTRSIRQQPSDCETCEMAARLALNCFLLRKPRTPLACLTPNFQDVATFYMWSKGSALPLDPTNTDLLAAALPGDIVLAILSRPSSPPPWQRAVEELFGIPNFAMGVGRSLGAIAFMGVEDPADESLHWVAWSFGSGSRALNRRAIDPRFGVVTALNRLTAETAGSESALRQLEYRTFGAYSQRTGHRAARDTPLDGFRIEPLTDMVSGVGGRTGGPNPAQVFGGRPLRTRGVISSVSDLARLAAEAINAFRSDSYRERYAFIDDYVPVEDEAVLVRLRERLCGAAIELSSSVDVFIPDDLVDYEDERALHYILLPGERRTSASRVTLTVDILAPVLSRLGTEGLEQELRFCDADHQEIASVAIIDCLSAELELDGGSYLAADGQFFLVDTPFLERLNSEARSIPITQLDLPCYSGEAEGTWNRAVAVNQPHEYVCVDAELVRLDGESPFEAADLVHRSGALIHVKRKGRSSALSYLFVQARRSCQFLGQVPAARAILRDVLLSAGTDAGAAGAIALEALAKNPNGVEIVLAIMGDWHERDLANLPLLAKVELVETVRKMGQWGFRPSAALVGLCSRTC